jgi:hypothetical protein
LHPSQAPVGYKVEATAPSLKVRKKISSSNIFTSAGRSLLLPSQINHSVLFFLEIMRFSFFSLSLVALKVVNAGLIIDLDLNGDKDVIPGSWIVVMNDGVSSEDFESHRSWAAGIVDINLGKRGHGGSRRAFDLHGWRGYIGDFDELTIQEIANRSEVRSGLPLYMSLTMEDTNKETPLGEICRA